MDQKQKIDRLKKKMDEKNKKKSIWASMWPRRKLEKPQKVAVLYLRLNGSAEDRIEDTRKGFFEIDGKTYHVQRDCQFRMGKDRIPLAVIEEEGLIPRGNHEFYKKLQQDQAFQKMVAKYQNDCITAIKNAELVRSLEDKAGSGFNIKVAIALGILGIIGYAIASGQGWI